MSIPKSPAPTTDSNFSDATHENVSKNDKRIWQFLFLALFGVFSFYILYSAACAGINADEDFQVKYSESLVDWYSGVKKDTASMTAVEKQCDALNFTYRNANMHYYGGFFEVIAGFSNRMLGYTSDQLLYHRVRHLWVAVFGLLAMFFTAAAVRKIAGQKAAVLALVLMFTSPYFFGNALMNPKDIPFCAGFAISLYYMMLFFNSMPERINWKIIAGIAVGLSIAIGTRAGGILLIAYFGLFALMHIASKYGIGKFFADRSLLLKYLKYGGIAVLSGYLGAILFWPYAMVSPLTHPLKALQEFDKFAIGIRVLYQGSNVMSDKTPWDYVLRSIFQTTPLVVWIGFFGGVVLFFALSKKYGFLTVFMGFFAAIFPVIYVLYKDSNMYNQWRHLLFVFPGIIIVSALALNYIHDILQSRNVLLGRIFLVLILFGVLPPALHIARNNQLSFVYYNEAVGGVKLQLGRNETDYWGMSVSDGIAYLEQQGILNENMDKQVTIISNMGYALQTYTKKYGDKVKWLYASYPNRYKYKWDYALYTSLFVNGDQIRSGNWPMKSSTIHTIDVSGVPVLAVMQQDTANHVFYAQQLIRENNLPKAIEHLKNELDLHPDNEVALSSLAECYLNVGDFASALSKADALLKCSPENASAYYLKALAQAQMGNLNGAVGSLQIAIKFNPDFAQARELLSQIRSSK